MNHKHHVTLPFVEEVGGGGGGGDTVIYHFVIARFIEVSVHNYRVH